MRTRATDASRRRAAPLRILVRVASITLLTTLACWSSGSYPPLERQRIGYANHGGYFPIEAGAIHDRPDCALCHGGTATFSDFTCIRCHDHARTHTDSIHAGVNGYAYDSTSCYLCHPNGTAAGVAHAPFFPIGSGTKHDLTCGDCHPDTHDHLVFTCISCHRHDRGHTDSTHVGVSGYRYESPSCLACHPRAEVISRDQHALFFPIATGAHALILCGDCHQVPGDYRTFTCVSCHDHAQAHTDSTHTGVPGYLYDSPSCLSCHPHGEVMSREQHASFFPIATGAHATNPCTDCHQNPADYRTFTCISCHDHDAQTMDPAHAGVPGYTFDSPSCLTCHPQGTAMTRAQHDPLFPIASGNHFLPCGDCHTTPRDFTKYECILCHVHTCDLMDPHHTQVPQYSCASSACYDCHPRGVSGN